MRTSRVRRSRAPRITYADLNTEQRMEMLEHAILAERRAQPRHLVAEYQFAAPRLWRFDFAFIADLVALEVEGGVWTKGRHTRGSGFLKDIEKYNTATVMGWRVIRCTPGTFTAPATIRALTSLLRQER